METIQERDERELHELNRLYEHIANAEVAGKKVLVVVLRPLLKLTQGPHLERFSMCIVTQRKGHLPGHGGLNHGLGTTVDGHRQRGAAVDHGVFAAQDQLAWCNCFHGTTSYMRLCACIPARRKAPV